MDKDRIKGAAEQAKGAVKKAAGKVPGARSLDAPWLAYLFNVSILRRAKVTNSQFGKRAR
jgi:hypothetical protein